MEFVFESFRLVVNQHCHSKLHRNGVDASRGGDPCKDPIEYFPAALCWNLITLKYVT